MDNMPSQTIELTWQTIAGRRVLVYTFRHGWTWQDFGDTKEVADNWLDALDNPVPLLFDLRAAPDMPPGMLTHTRAITESRHPNGSPVILLGVSGVVQTTYDIVRRMLGARAAQFTGDVRVVKTWDDVVRVLESPIS